MASDPLLGKTLGEFEVLEPIGQGGMGVVYKGRQTALDRLVAIKTLPAHLAANSAFVQRFLREARSAGKLRHPNIVQAYDVGQAEGHYFFAMEFVDGETLEPDRALDVMKQVCSALAAAHKEGIVHRDIKPSNIMLDKEGQVRVTDFGLAKRADDASVTQTTDVLGTPLYMAPEAATGAEHCPQSDLYSLGATFYHLLSGRPPFAGKTSGELIVKHVTEEPPPLHDAAPDVDLRLSRIIDRLLAKSLAKRYGSAEAVLRDLEALGPLRSRAQAAASEGRALIAGAPTAAMTQGRRLARQALAQRLVADQRRTRKRRIVLAAGAAIVALALALVVALPRGRRAGQAVLPDLEQQNIEAREHNARALLRSAQTAGKARDWDGLKAHLESLEEDYGKTQLFAGNRAAIEALRKQAEAPPKEETKPAPKIEVAPAPKPKPPEELLAEAGMAKGLLVAFYAGRDFERFIAAKTVPQIGFNWGPGAPLPGVPADDFSARFVGWLQIRDAGDYTFRFWRDDGARLYLDGKLLINEWEVCNQGRPTTVRLDKGMHRLWVEYMELVGMAALALHWSQGGQEAVVPAAVLYCETELLARVRQKPAEDPLAGLRPDGAGQVPGPQVAAVPGPGEWVSLFDGNTLDGWQVGGRDGAKINSGEVRVENGTVVLAARQRVGMARMREAPGAPFEIEFETMLVAGHRLASLYFPVGDSTCGLVIGGINGSLVGLDGVDGRGYRDNQALARMGFERNRWYTVRVRVGTTIQVWIDGKQLIDFRVHGHTFGFNDGREALRPIALDAYSTTSAVRNIRARRLGGVGPPAEWASLFDGKTLDGWKVVAERKYARHGRVEAQNGEIVLGTGAALTGIAWTRYLPAVEYELAFEAMCTAGGNNWCNFTFPVGASGCSFCFLGIGDGLAGLDQVDGMPVTRNVTTKKMNFERNRWYRVRLRVTRGAINAWIDDAEVVALQLKDHAVNVYDDFWGPLKPFGVANWESTTALRNIRFRSLEPGAAPAVAAGDLGPMVAEPTQPFDAVFSQETEKQWVVEGDWWTGEGADITGSAYHNGWLALRDRRLGDFVLEADVTDMGGEVGFRYGIIFRRVGDWQLLFSLSTQYPGASLQAVSAFRPRPEGAVPGVAIRAQRHAVSPKRGERYHLKVECLGTRVRCWVGDQLVAEAEDKALLSGGVVLYVHRANVRFSNIRIRRPEAPAPGAVEGIGKLWCERAERMAADEKLTARAKLLAWEDLLARFPKAPADAQAQCRQQRDRWAKEVAESLGIVTERTKEFERRVFRAPVRELADGRFRIVYNAFRPREYGDWETLLGYAHIARYQFFCTCQSNSFHNAFGWNFDLGNNFKVRFHAKARRAHGCTLFALPGDPLQTGIVLTIGAEDNHATTLGPPGQAPWFRSNVVAANQWLEHELEVAGGELVYRHQGKEAFRRGFDPSAFRGRRLVLWATVRTEDRPSRWETPEFHRIHIVSAAQPDWVPGQHASLPPHRYCNRPGADGWLSLWHPEGITVTTVRRGTSQVAGGDTMIFRTGGSGGDWLSYELDSGLVSDCVVAVRAEFVSQEREGWRGGRPPDWAAVRGWLRGSLGITFRKHKDTQYVALLCRGSDAELQRCSVAGGGRRAGESVARSRDFRTPDGPLYLLALIKGKRVELYCNGQLALTYDGLPEVAGLLGILADEADVIVHDFKWRPLPSDPSYKKLYGEGRR